MDLGDELGPQRRVAPASDHIAAFSRASDVPERLFTDPTYAQALGNRGIIVPGPMLAALLEQFLRSELPEWRVERLSTTFRIPTIAEDPLLLRGVIAEHHETADGERIVCDLVIEHCDGERAVTSTVTLRRGPSVG